MINKRSVITAAVIILFGISLSVNAGAAEAPPANTYSGDFWSRSTLTGDWGGVRNDLAKKGVTFDLSLTQVYQGIVERRQEEGLGVRRPRRPQHSCRHTETRLVARRVPHGGG